MQGPVLCPLFATDSHTSFQTLDPPHAAQPSGKQSSVNHSKFFFLSGEILEKKHLSWYITKKLSFLNNQFSYLKIIELMLQP